MVGEYCSSDRLGKEPRCRELCKKYRGACNEAAEEYCDEDEYDEGFCACLRSPIKTGVAECLDNQCDQHGYKTAAEKPECDQTICSVYYDIKDVGEYVDFNHNVIKQQCGETSSPDEGDEGGDEGDEGGDEGDEDTEGMAFGDIKSADDFKAWAMENKEIISLFAIAGAAILIILLLKGR
jgi:hypothetical protein